MLAAVRRHLSLQSLSAAVHTHQNSVQHLRTILASSQPGLSGRELDVCARVMTGMTYEGIAVDLGLKLPTVKTYRNRAFERLGIHFRSELVRYYLDASTRGGGA
jgi:DNA-binding CsgD family transcriptional regulator